MAVTKTQPRLKFLDQSISENGGSMSGFTPLPNRAWVSSKAKMTSTSFSLSISDRKSINKS